MSISVSALMRAFATTAVALALAACATQPAGTGQTAEDEVNDPLETVNRGVFQFNEGVDTVVLRPAAQAYRAVLPSFVQDSVQTLVRTVSAPVVLANDLLQGNGEAAAQTGSRFLVNVALGLGVFDVASSAGIPYHAEDFGQTLAVWGAGEGPYLVLPFFGPSNARDAGGRVVDTLADP
ncbi:MAG TPA: VacJ family lipoprotein, partial [Alphaproteobacteria bacterium]|nr:VacJ family lipoprotein [Alphaproteobacteria bacterium]